MSLDDSKLEARAVLNAIALGGGPAAAAIPASILPELKSSEAAKADQVDRVASWLTASPWELRKCRSLKGALATTADVLRRGRAKPAVPEAPEPPPPAVQTCELQVDRASLAAEHGLGLKLVRFAVLDALTSDERAAAHVGLGLVGDTLRVAVHLPCYASGETAGVEALERAHAAAARCAEPMRVTVALEGVSVGNIVGRGGIGVRDCGVRSLHHALNIKLRDAVNAACAGSDDRLTLTMSRAKRCTLGSGDGRGAVFVRLPSRAEQANDPGAAAMRLTILVARGAATVDDATRRVIGVAVGAAAQEHVRNVKSRLSAGRAAAVARSDARALAAAVAAPPLSGRRVGRGLIGRGAIDLEGACVKEARDKKLWRDATKRRGRRQGSAGSGGGAEAAPAAVPRATPRERRVTRVKRHAAWLHSVPGELPEALHADKEQGEGTAEQQQCRPRPAARERRVPARRPQHPRRVLKAGAPEKPPQRRLRQWRRGINPGAPRPRETVPSRGEERRRQVAHFGGGGGGGDHDGDHDAEWW